MLRAAGFSPIDNAAAVWLSDAAGKQRIEFMTPHRGTARSQGRITAVEGRPGIGAVSLDGLQLLGRFTRKLALPLRLPDGRLEVVRVTVPTLGAFLVGKALTFMRRPADVDSPGHPKGAKDLLYIRDVMAAGPGVVAAVEADLAAIVASEEPSVESAASNVYLALHGEASKYLQEAAAMLAERELIQMTAAQRDLEGHITDLLEILRERSDSI